MIGGMQGHEARDGHAEHDERVEARVMAECAAEIDTLVRAIDEHMVVNHQGVFNRGDDPKIALNKIACFEQDLGAYFAKEKLAEQASLIESLIDALNGFPALCHIILGEKACECSQCRAVRLKTKALAAVEEWRKK